MNAKVAVYDSAKGSGIIIKENGEKVDFSLDDWSDFETLPEVGLHVVFSDDGKISPIDSPTSSITGNNEEKDIEQLMKLKNEYIHEQSGKGWIQISDNEAGFVLEKPKEFSVLRFILSALILGAIGYFIGGVYGLAITFVISIFIGFRKKQWINGTIEKEGKKIILKSSSLPDQTINLYDKDEEERRNNPIFYPYIKDYKAKGFFVVKETPEKVILRDGSSPQEVVLVLNDDQSVTVQ